jgi:hypothetical protein
MPYIRRSAEGSILALLHDAQADAQEFLPATDPEVSAFLGMQVSNNFAGLDSEFIRVMEDLIDVMLEKGLLRLTDLPGQAQSKLLARKDMRRKMKGALNLLGGNDVI